MAEIKKKLRSKIEEQNITVDEKTGIAKVEITLSPRRHGEFAVKAITDTARVLVEESGLVVEKLITACTINNKYGKVSGFWEFQIRQVVKKSTSRKKTPPKKTTPSPKSDDTGFFKNREKKKGAE